MIKTTLFFSETHFDFLEYCNALEIKLDYDLKLKIGDELNFYDYVHKLPLNEFIDIQQNTNISDNNLAKLQEKISNIGAQFYTVVKIYYELNSDKSVTRVISLELK